MTRADVAVIGGSGLYSIDGLREVEEITLETPFGKPSDAITIGNLEGVRVAFLPRHGRGHTLLPSEVPARANIFALKLLGIRQVIAVSAVGSLRDDYQPMDMVIPDQIVDNTRRRPGTFFGDGIVAHIPFAHPFCNQLSKALYQAARATVERTHAGGTYVCMEGPAFSTFAESESYRHMGFSIIGMTAVPEARLAREAEMCYAVLAQVTDYDCWHPDHESVTSDMVIANVGRNVVNARAIIQSVIPLVQGFRDCRCRHALQGAIATARGAMKQETVDKLAPLLRSHITREA